MWGLKLRDQGVKWRLDDSKLGVEMARSLSEEGNEQQQGRGEERKLPSCEQGLLVLLCFVLFHLFIRRTYHLGDSEEQGGPRPTLPGFCLYRIWLFWKFVFCLGVMEFLWVAFSRGIMQSGFYFKESLWLSCEVSTTVDKYGSRKTRKIPY